MHCLFSLVMENFCSRQLEFELVQVFLDSWIADCFVRHAWFALSVSFRGEFVAQGSWNFELSNYSWTVGLQIVSCDTHGLHYLFPFVENFLLEAVGLLSLSNYA